MDSLEQAQLQAVIHATTKPPHTVPKAAAKKFNPLQLNCLKKDWKMATPTISIPLTLRPREYRTKVMTYGKHQGRTFDWVIRNDPKYAHWAMERELNDNIEDPLAIFAHYCLETSDLAKFHKSRPMTRSGGPCNMVSTTYTGTGRSLRTGGFTVDMFAMRALEISDCPRRFKGYDIDGQALKTTISLIAEGKLSLDCLSWLWNPGNYLVTPNDEIYHFTSISG